MSDAEELVGRLQGVTRRLRIVDDMRRSLARFGHPEEADTTWKARLVCKPRFWFYCPHRFPSEVEPEDDVLEEFYAFLVHRVQQLETDERELKVRLSRMEERA